MIGRRFCEIARAQPELPALITGERVMSYEELLQAGEDVRRRLEAAAVRRGDVVACPLAVCWEAVASFVGCALLGAAFLPVNPAWGRDEISWLLKRVAPATAIVGAEDGWLAAGIAPARLMTALDWEWPTASGESREAVEVEPNDAVAYQLTSGSEGEPKIAVKSGGRFLASMRAVASVVGMKPGRRILIAAPFHFGFSFSWNMLLPLVSGGAMVLLERFEPAAAVDLIHRHGVQCLWGSPVLYSLLAGARLPAGSLATLELCISGGAPLNAAVNEEWRRLSKAGLRQAYGTTEAGMIAIQREAELPEGCVGLPPSGTEIRIYDGDRMRRPGEPGEIAVRGPGVMAGYLNDAAATEALLVDGFLRTGDAGWLDQQGRLYWSGRIRPWINAGGVKVDPIEVQNVLRRMPGVRDCVVRGEAGPGGIELVAAYITSEPGVVLTRADVIRHSRQGLAENKIPRMIRFTSAAAQDLTGKIPVKL